MRSKVQRSSATPAITVYGTTWCHLTRALCEHLQHASLAFEYHDIEQDSQAEQTLTKLHKGKRKFPTVVIGELILHKPAADEMQKVLLGMDLGAGGEAPDSNA